MTDREPGGNEATQGAVGGTAEPSDPDDDLTQSLGSLSRLATAHLALEDTLTQVARFAGLTLLEENRADTIVSTADFVTKVDKIQYSLGEGPCISAAAEGRTFSSGSLGGEQRWPRFGPRVARLGVHSVLSLPLLTPDGVLGAMNVYAHRKAIFDDHAVNIGELFAVPAAIAVQNALVLAQAKRLASNLQAALVSRAVIDQAMGIVMSRTGCSASEAFDRLRTRSQTEHLKVSAVAQSVVDAAVRRARARRAIEDPPAP
jgi:GAF domain-containing protein